MEFIRLLASRETLEMMSASDKLAAGLMVAIIGMSITFLALIFLMMTIRILSRLVEQGKSKLQQTVVEIAPKPSERPKSSNETDDLELVAVITAALAASLGKPAHQIIVKNIVRVPDQKPAWAKQGLSEQINQQL